MAEDGAPDEEPEPRDDEPEESAADADAPQSGDASPSTDTPSSAASTPSAEPVPSTESTSSDESALSAGEEQGSDDRDAEADATEDVDADPDEDSGSSPDLDSSDDPDDALDDLLELDEPEDEPDIDFSRWPAYDYSDEEGGEEHVGEEDIDEEDIDEGDIDEGFFDEGDIDWEGVEEEDIDWEAIEEESTVEEDGEEEDRPFADLDAEEVDAELGMAATEGEAASDGGVYADGTIEGSTHFPGEDDWPTNEGAPDDQEMPLADHIEEMVRRLGVVVVVMALVSGVVFPFGEELINFIWYSILPAAGTDEIVRPHVYHPLALILARLKVATLAGFIVALPVFVYETYLFMRPGLYPTERRYYLASVPMSLVLATVGVAFAFFLVLPILFTYFLYYTQDVTVIAFGLTETFNLMVMMLGFFAFIFQIPLFIMLAIMMGLTSRQWLADRRLYFYGGFLGVAFLFSPDPTGMAPILVATTMVALFEGTLFLLKWTGRGKRVVKESID